MYNDRKLLLKVRNGTRGDKRLCDTCSHGHIMKGSAESEEVVHCNFISEAIPLRVVECSNYSDKSVPGLHEMKAIAWMLRTDRSGQHIGFVDPKRWRKEQRDRGLDEDFD